MRPRTNQFKHHLGWTIVVDDSMILLLNLYPKGPNEHAVSNPSFIICRAIDLWSNEGGRGCSVKVLAL